MDPNKQIEKIGEIADDADAGETVSVDDFIKQLEAREKDLHITAETTIIEIASSFDDANVPDFLKVDLKLETPSQFPSATAASAKPKSTIPTPSTEKEMASLKEKISQMQAERQELVESSHRRLKDFENFKSRTERERNETFQSQIGNLATKMLPALDNLNRAVDFALAMPDEQRSGIQPFLDGVMLVSQQLDDVLGEMGIEPIATVGETFDPHFHEAVAAEESVEFDPNTVTVELLRGYRNGNRVIRHSMVKVAKAPTSGDELPTDETPAMTLDEDSPPALDAGPLTEDSGPE